MQLNKLSNFINGWFIGNFEPSLFSNTDFEVAVKYYKTGDTEFAHYHKMATEFTVIAKGKVMMNGVEIHEGGIVTIAPDEITDFKVLEDTITVVVKLPSVKNDKFLKG